MEERKKERGRPRREEPPLTHIVVYLDYPTVEAMDQAAEKAGLSRSGWIREAIKKRLAEEEERPGSC